MDQVRYYTCDQFHKYEITRKGVVRHRVSKHVCTPHISSKGYVILDMYIDEKRKRRVPLHRLLLHTFFPIEDECSMQVNHKDGNKQNNNLSNLEWATASQNIYHAHATGLTKDNKPVYAYCAYSGEYVGKYRSSCEMARVLGVSRSKIGECCRGVRRRCGDYIASFLYIPILPINRRVTMKSWKWSKCK